MTPRQTSLYFREWGYVRGYCKAHRLPEPDRHALHVQALGADKSSKEFTNEDFDKVLAVFRAIHQPANVNAQLRQIREPRKRAEFPFPELFKLLGLYVGDVDAYVASICLDQFGTPDWRDLSETVAPEKYNPRWKSSQLQKLRYSLNKCLNGKTGLRNKAGDSLHDMRIKAGLKCTCASICAKRARISFVMGGQRVGEAKVVTMVPAGDIEENEPF